MNMIYTFILIAGQMLDKQNLSDYAHIQTPADFAFIDVDAQGNPLKPTPYR